MFADSIPKEIILFLNSVIFNKDKISLVIVQTRIAVIAQSV